jgi:putative methionine-R-sulfoxide reductase with GAF domain
MYDPMVVDAFLRLKPMLAATLESSAYDVSSMVQPERHATRSEWPSERRDEVALFRVYQLIAESGDRPWRDTADLVLHRLSGVIAFDAALVALYDAVSDDLVCETIYGLGLEQVKGRRVTIGDGVTGWVAAHKQTVVNSPGALDDNADTGHVFGGFLSCASAPILRGEALVGVLSVYAKRGEAFGREQADVLQGVARHLAPVLRRRRLVGQTPFSNPETHLTAAHLDQYVRQFFDSRPVLSLYGVVLRVATPFSDVELSSFLDVVRTNLRGGDLVFVCDERTVVCLPADGDATSARAASDRIVKSVFGENDEHFEVTVIELPNQEASLAALLSRAEYAFGDSRVAS